MIPTFEEYDPTVVHSIGLEEDYIDLEDGLSLDIYDCGLIVVATLVDLYRLYTSSYERYSSVPINNSWGTS